MARTIGDQELALLQHLAEHGEATVGEMTASFGAPRGLARSTVLTMMERLRRKGHLGRRLVDGAKSVRIFGETYPVRAKLFTINGLSAHADRDALLAWVGRFRRPPAQTWVVHGEPLASHALRDEIERRHGWRVAVAERGARCPL